MSLRSTAPHYERSERRHDMLAEHEAVVGGGRGLVVHIDVFAQIPLGEVGHRGRRRIRLQRRAGLEPCDKLGGFFPGLVGRDRSMPTHPHARFDRPHARVWTT